MENVVNLDDIKNYLRIDYDEDDRLLQSLTVVAESYIRDAVTNLDEVIKDYRELERVKLLIAVMVQELYDNRESTEKREYSYTVRALLTQLQTKQGD